MENKEQIKKIFKLLTLGIILELIAFAIPSIGYLLFGTLAVFVIGGILLIPYAREAKGNLKTFLFITAISAVAPVTMMLLFGAIELSNVITPENEDFYYNVVAGTAEIIAVYVAPLVVLIGMIGSKKLLTKEKKK